MMMRAPSVHLVVETMSYISQMDYVIKVLLLHLVFILQSQGMCAISFHELSYIYI